MQRWGRAIGRRAGWVLAFAAVLVGVAGWFGVGVFDRLHNGGFDDPASESSRAAGLIADEFAATRTDIVVLYSATDLDVDDPAFAQAVADVVDRLDPASVAATTTWWDTQAPSLVSADRHSTQVLLRLSGADDEERLASYERVRDDLSAAGLTTRVSGQYAVFDDVNEQVAGDIARAESIALPIVFLLSLVVFGSVVSALMPTLVGGIAVLGAFAVVRLLTEVTDVSVFAINVVTLLGMGLAIDYALFVVSRFREELERSGDRVEAITATMATAGRTVFFSGTIVTASLASLLIFPQGFLTSMGWGGMAAVLVAMLASLTVLPAVLVLLGHRLEWGTMPWRRRARGRSGEGWARLAGSVMRRPVAYLVAVTAALLVLASPFLGARWGSVDERVLPVDSPSRVASDALAEIDGSASAGATAVLRGADDTDAQRWAEAAAGLPGVEEATMRAAAGEDRLVEVTWSGEPQSEGSQSLVRELRDLPGDLTDGAEVLVGGQSAVTVDLVDSIGERLPWMAALVAAVMLVLLFVAFGSVLLPLKAIVMNAVSITASFGVVTWIFQDGNLSGLLGFTSTGYLDATQPILMLAILFGLSMDYEVFLLSRVREAWDRTHDNTAAVVEGVRATGRIITSAALLLAVVIGGFATSGIVFLKMIGVGMLVAVLLDATVVRGLLVPATMRLLGRANWWAPGPLARWWERHGHREHARLTGTAAAVPQQSSPSSGTVPSTR